MVFASGARVEEAIAKAKAALPGWRATSLAGAVEQRFDSDGWFLGVSLLDHVKPGTKVYDDEIFGPVLSVVRAESYGDAVDPAFTQVD